MNAMTHADMRVDLTAQEPGQANGKMTIGDAALIGAFLTFAVLNVALAFRYNINWDEYYYLAQIYTAQDGRPLEALQTFHVHLLAWVPRLPLSEADQIIVGRLFMMLCQTVSVACLYHIAREFADRRNAAFAALAYLASGYVLAHGASFRTDPLAGMLMMSALALLFRAPLKAWVAAAAGVIAAVAFLVTIKVVFFAPAFAAAFLWRWSQTRSPRGPLAHFALAAAVAAAAGIGLFLLHAGSLAGVAANSPASGAIVGPAAATAGQALDKVILSQGLFPRSVAIRDWLLFSGLSIALVALGAHTAFRMLRTDERLRGAALLCLLLPLLSLVVYRNAFAYFFPFIFLAPAILAAPGAARLPGFISRNLLIVGMVTLLVGQGIAFWDRDQSVQRGVARAAHQIFPEPVPYIDRNGMLPSFPKANQFMSSWGVEGMLARGVPVIRRDIETRHPPLLIANSRLLKATLDPSVPYAGDRLHPGDQAALRASYIRHWGPIWVAGKVLGGTSGAFTLLIPGTYTLECTGSRRIDGNSHVCGSTVSLAQGRHEWAGGDAVLRWGDNLPRPAATVPNTRIYYGL